MGITALQTTVFYWLIIIGLKLAGRRIFGELGPQDLAVLLLISDAANIGLTPSEGGFCSSIGSVCTLMLWGSAIERTPAFRNSLDVPAIALVEDGQVNHQAMRRDRVDEEDLSVAARRYGVSGPECFDRMTLGRRRQFAGRIEARSRRYASCCYP
ncbi:MAG: hypothetical protein IPK79_01815 [Vampirovibrionales bacterium]|nr:hypothetical protein [Vampirovibrionales bacterium]